MSEYRAVRCAVCADQPVPGYVDTASGEPCNACNGTGLARLDIVDDLHDLFGDPCPCAVCNGLGARQIEWDGTKLVRCEVCRRFRDDLKSARELQDRLWVEAPPYSLAFIRQIGDVLAYLSNDVRALARPSNPTP